MNRESYTGVLFRNGNDSTGKLGRVTKGRKQGPHLAFSSFMAAAETMESNGQRWNDCVGADRLDAPCILSKMAKNLLPL